MIIFIEGPRNSGKTTLIEEFFKQNKDPDIIYYKFYFAKYLDQFNINENGSKLGIHYFSISNILTILELNRTLLKDKILVFDRSIFSAYVWSIMMERLDEHILLSEFEKILDSELYSNCTLIFLEKSKNIKNSIRNKDCFDTFENYDAELSVFNNVITMFDKYIYNSEKNNNFNSFINNFDKKSINDFIELLSNLTSYVDK
jgi:thymidylate kinase